MKKKVSLLLVGAVLLAVFLALWLWTHVGLRRILNKGTNTPAFTNPPPQTTNSSRSVKIASLSGVYNYNQGDLPSKPLINQVFYNATGFDPAKLSTTKGSIVTIFNMSPKILILSGDLLTTEVQIAPLTEITVGSNNPGTFTIQNKNDNRSLSIQFN